jgi:hypothetical protein
MCLYLQVRATRARVRGLTARITNMLKGYPGEPSEKGGRICVAAPAGNNASWHAVLFLGEVVCFQLFQTSSKAGCTTKGVPQKFRRQRVCSAARRHCNAQKKCTGWSRGVRPTGQVGERWQLGACMGQGRQPSTALKLTVRPWLPAVLPDMFGILGWGGVQEVCPVHADCDTGVVFSPFCAVCSRCFRPCKGSFVPLSGWGPLQRSCVCAPCNPFSFL